MLGHLRRSAVWGCVMSDTVHALAAALECLAMADISEVATLEDDDGVPVEDDDGFRVTGLSSERVAVWEAARARALFSVGVLLDLARECYDVHNATDDAINLETEPDGLHGALLDLIEAEGGSLDW